VWDNLSNGSQGWPIAACRRATTSVLSLVFMMLPFSTPQKRSVFHLLSITPFPFSIYLYLSLVVFNFSLFSLDFFH